jgi:hypothetical protein
MNSRGARRVVIQKSWDIGLVLVPTMLLSTPSVGSGHIRTGRRSRPPRTEAEPTWKGDSDRFAAPADARARRSSRVSIKNAQRARGPFVRDIREVGQVARHLGGWRRLACELRRPSRSRRVGRVYLARITRQAPTTRDGVVHEDTGRAGACRRRGPPPIASSSSSVPLSEASIGNVGMRPNTTGWVRSRRHAGGCAGIHRRGKMPSTDT